jgi:hypothetical protein
MSSTLVRRLAVLLACFLVPLAAPAQEPPRFLIETIRVQGVQRETARQIVLDESLLQTGRTYSEPELRQAVYRIKRLSFVVDAEFSLAKGSERGAYELVITVEEARPLFYLADVQGMRVREGFPGAKSVFKTRWQESATAGGRYFVGSHGLVFASVQKVWDADGEMLQAGYTRYNLFGNGSFGTLQVSKTVGLGDEGLQQGTFLSLGVPLSGVQSLRLDVRRDEVESDLRFSFGGGEVHNEYRSEDWGADFTWILNTTDDPLFPSSGIRIDAGGGYAGQRNRFRTTGGGEDFEERSSPTIRSLYLDGRRYWPVSPRQSLSTELIAARYRFTMPDGTVTESRVVVNLGYALDLLGFGQDAHTGDLRFETILQGVYYDASAPFTSRTTSKNAALYTSLAYRNAWGVTRLTFVYEDLWSDR